MYQPLYQISDESQVYIFVADNNNHACIEPVYQNKVSISLAVRLPIDFRFTSFQRLGFSFNYK